MESSPHPQSPHLGRENTAIGRPTLIMLIALLASLALCIAFSFTTRDSLQHLPTRKSAPGAMARTAQTLVDQSPWQTVQSLVPLAFTAEENQLARQAQRLADHEVDQAFAAALREATLRVEHRSLTGEALALSQRVDQLQQIVAQDQATVKQLTADANGADQNEAGSDLEIAKAQLGLDSDELADANDDLDRATGDERSQVQAELAAHEVDMKKYDSGQGSDGQITVLSVGRYGTLAGRLAAWNRQQTRIQLIRQAQQQAMDDARRFTEKHNTLEAQANSQSKSGTGSVDNRPAKLAAIKDLSIERQLLGIYDDRIKTEQQLADVYGKWATQVQLQHRILLHLILRSVAWVIVILICMVLGHVAVRHVMHYPVLDPRYRHTLRAVLELAIQIIGILCILFVLFGAPQQTSTILGLTTAALTIALQDFVVAFFGWFVLMSKRGMRVGDTVEINGVGGEVTEIGLMSTTLLETGPLSERGYPTGRRITFMNSFAIRGQFFNFSTAGQWMLDHFSVSIPASDETHLVVDKILKSVEAETAPNARQAELEWRRFARTDRLKHFSAAPSVNLRPAGDNFDLEVRYVTRATDRIETRNRLYQRVIDLLHHPAEPVESTQAAARDA